MWVKWFDQTDRLEYLTRGSLSFTLSLLLNLKKKPERNMVVS